jgi:PAS domain S-box-containing protein
VDEILEGAPAGFLSFGDDGTVTLVNQYLLDVLGLDRATVVGRHVEGIMMVGTRIFYQTHWFPLLRLHGVAEEIFLQLRDASGAAVGVLVNAARRERNGVAAFDCFIIQVRERAKYEAELLKARQVAEAAQAELTAKAEELIRANAHLEELTTELQLQQDQLYDQATQLEETSEELRVTNEHLLQRIDEAEELRVTADEANRAKSTFLAVMSHELRTPMNAIGGYVQLMEMGIHGPVTPAQLEALHRIQVAQRHLLRLINDVLNLARIESGRVDYVMEDVEISETLAVVAPMIEPQMQARDLDFSVRVELPHFAYADREKVQQILINLLGNAAKFTQPGGRVDVETSESADGSEVLIRVRDTGIGIPPDKLGRVFEPFVQVDSSHTRSAEGTGLGLAISRDLALGMGGDLRAESNPGKGSTFTLVLKTADARPDPPTQPPEMLS